MTNPSKDKGDRAERAIVAWLKDVRGLAAERIRSGRSTDPGDIVWPGSDWLLDSKSQKRWQLAAWFFEAEVEAAHESEQTGRRIKPLVVLRRDGRSDPGEWLAVVRLEDLEL